MESELVYGLKPLKQNQQFSVKNYLSNWQNYGLKLNGSACFIQE